MPLSNEVGLGPGHIVLDGDPAGTQPPQQPVPTFRPMSIVAKWSPISATAEILLRKRKIYLVVCFLHFTHCTIHQNSNSWLDVTLFDGDFCSSRSCNIWNVHYDGAGMRRPFRRPQSPKPICQRWRLLWPPYVIGQAIIFLPCDFYLSIYLSIFFYLA